MAQVSTGYWLSVTLVDNGGNTSTKSFQMRADATDPADYGVALSSAAAVVASLDAITDAVVAGYQLEQRYVEDALALPAVGVQIENQALLDFAIDGNPFKSATLTVPAPVIGIFAGASGVLADTVDVADPALVTFVNQFKGGALLYISDGEDADATAPLKSGRRIHRRSNKRRSVRQG